MKGLRKDDASYMQNLKLFTGFSQCRVRKRHRPPAHQNTSAVCKDSLTPFTRATYSPFEAGKSACLRILKGLLTT